MNAADWWPVADRAVWSPVVVVVEPVWQRGVSLSVRAVGEPEFGDEHHRIGVLAVQEFEQQQNAGTGASVARHDAAVVASPAQIGRSAYCSSGGSQTNIPTDPAAGVSGSLRMANGKGPVRRAFPAENAFVDRALGGGSRLSTASCW